MATVARNNRYQSDIHNDAEVLSTPASLCIWSAGVVAVRFSRRRAVMVSAMEQSVVEARGVWAAGRPIVRRGRVVWLPAGVASFPIC